MSTLSRAAVHMKNGFKQSSSSIFKNKTAIQHQRKTKKVYIKLTTASPSLWMVCLVAEKNLGREKKNVQGLRGRLGQFTIFLKPK